MGLRHSFVIYLLCYWFLHIRFCVCQFDSNSIFWCYDLLLYSHLSKPSCRRQCRSAHRKSTYGTEINIWKESNQVILSGAFRIYLLQSIFLRDGLRHFAMWRMQLWCYSLVAGFSVPDRIGQLRSQSISLRVAHAFVRKSLQAGPFMQSGFFEKGRSGKFEWFANAFNKHSVTGHFLTSVVCKWQ